MKPANLLLWATLVTLAASSTVLAQLGQTAPSVGLNYQIAAQDRDSIVWEATELVTNSAGQVRTHGHRIVQLETGMSYWDGAAWQPSSAALEITSSNIVGNLTAHQIVLGPTLTANPLLAVAFPDGRQLTTRLLGIEFEDTVTKSNVFISVVTNAPAQLVLHPDGSPGSRVLYTNAFSGPVSATVEYVQQRDGVEQNVIFQTQLPDPLTNYFMFPSNVVVSVVTEILSGPAPVISRVRVPRSAGVTPGVPGPFVGEYDGDDRIDFGGMAMTVGKGFPLPSPGGSPLEAAAHKLRVRKTYQQIGGMNVLFKRLDFLDLQRELQGLPPPNLVAILPDRPALVRHFPNPKPTTEPIVPRQIARAPVQRGFAQDFSIVSSATNLVFAGDTTYLLTGTVNASSTTTLEGGAVLKLVNTNSAGLVTLGDINCTARAYYPCVFTAASDGSVGEAITGAGSLSGYYGSTALETDASNGRLQWLRFSYLSNTITDYGTGTRLANCQFVRCYTGYNLQNAYVELNNVLFAGLGGTALLGYDPTFTLYQVTMDSCVAFDFESLPASSEFNVTNSLLVNAPFSVTNAIYLTNFTVTVTNAPWNFQTVGAGGHYLPPYSPYHGLGTTNVPWRVTAGVQGATTWAPVTVASNSVYNATNIVFSPQIPRDGWGTAYDLGYHYPTLDFLLLGPVLCTNTTILLTNGVCIGAWGSTSGGQALLGVHDSSSLVSEGWPTNLNRVTFCQTVQEDDTNALSGLATLLDTENTNGTLPSLYARFTDLTGLANGYSEYAFETVPAYSCANVFFRDCHFGSLVIDTSQTTGCGSCGLFNNVLERTYFEAYGSSVVGLTNNYHHGGVLYIAYSTTNVAIEDSLFDSVTVYNTSSSPTLANNAYWNTTQLTPTNAHDVILTSALAFVNGPLGPWYQPANSSLLGMGNQISTNVGLYQYTSQFSQAKHGTNLTDIGFSYVACAPPAPTAVTNLWLTDAFPSGASVSGWTWQSSSPSPLTGSQYLTVNSYGGLNQAYFIGSTGPFYVARDATLFCSIYIPAGSVPTTMEFQWNDINGYWEHRAYWGADDIGWGVDGTVARRYMGPVPATTGAWIQLTVPASAVGLEDCYVSGMAYTLYGGVADFDSAGVINPTWPTALADTGGSGLPDYFSDRNGDGSFDSGDLGNWQMADTAYDGVTDLQEWLAGNNPASPANPPSVPLGYWRFNNTNWSGEQGQLPLLATNVQNLASTSFDGNALQATSVTVGGVTNSALIYRMVETNGNENLTVDNGTIRFLFYPFWTQRSLGGSGPNHWVRLVEVGHYTSGATYGLFAVSIDPSGDYIYLQTQDAYGNSETNVTLCITNQLTANHWHSLVVAYSDGCGIELDQDGYHGTNYPFYVPTNTVRAQGFSIGSSMDGTMPLDGMIDEFETFNSQSAVVSDYTYRFWPSAGGSTVPTKIVVNFYQPMQPLATSQTIQRVTVPQNTSTNLTTSFYGITYVDTNVVVNQAYQYNLLESTTLRASVCSGINLAETPYRGKVILLVDSTLTNSLNASLQQLQSDLQGDGWIVTNFSVPRHDDVTWVNNTTNILTIKSIVTNTYNLDPTNTKSVFIIGHVSIPYSGYRPDDGHSYCVVFPDGSHSLDHQGAWPADSYYGDVDGNWTDVGTNAYINSRTCATSPYLTNTNFPANDNSPLDGRWDQDSIPTNAAGVAQIELAVGRVDFYGLGEMTNGTEVQLLKQYLAKDHAFRIKATVLPATPIYNDFIFGGGFLENGSGNGSSLFGLNSLVSSVGEPFAQTNGAGHLFAVEAGLGGSDSIQNSLGTTDANLADSRQEPRIGIYLLDGSWFGDFNITNDLMRACLGTPNYGLAAIWGGGATPFLWDLQDVALGAPIGAAMVRTLNDTNQVDLAAGGFREISIMGDPTLRLQIVAPPTDLNAWSVGGGTVLLAWAPAAETNAQYFVYRSPNSAGPFTNRLNSLALSVNSFTDTTAPSGTNTYMVRTAVLTTTGSGSFTNLSQGVVIQTP